MTLDDVVSSFRRGLSIDLLMRLSSISTFNPQPSKMVSLLVFFLAWNFFATSLAQQCYYLAGQVAGSAYLPCTQPDFPGFVSCCGLGHFCLDDNACWVGTLRASSECNVLTVTGPRIQCNVSLRMHRSNLPGSIVPRKMRLRYVYCTKSTVHY